MQKTVHFIIVLAATSLVIIIFSIFLYNQSERVNSNKIIAETRSTKVLASLSRGLIANKFTADNDVTLILVGDIMLGRTVMGKSYEENDYLYPFRKVSEYLRGSDIVFANLENPVVKDCPFTETSMIFCSTPEMLEGLNFAGINVVNLSNNHTGNYGNKGILSTIEYLDGTNIDHTGLGDLVIRDINGIRLGILGFNYTYGYNAEILDRDLKLIKDSDGVVDHLIVGVHWGQEYKDVPSGFQEEMARKMIESGADVISGHHPHWIQTTDTLGNTPVYYSLGNFVFDQMWSEKTRTGLVVKLKISKDEVYEIERRNVYMREWAQPEFVETQ